jgi:hypothetical protein
MGDAMRSIIVVCCLVILAGLGGGVAWGWIESHGAGPAAAVGPARAEAKPVDPNVQAPNPDAQAAANREAAREITGAVANATTSPMEFDRKMEVPYNVASQVMIGKAMSVNQTLTRSWARDSVLRLNVGGLTNQKTTSTITENGQPVMTTTIWVESADHGEASVLRMKVVHDPDRMARLLSQSHPRKGAQDVGPKISSFAIKAAMSLVASQSTREMEKAYGRVMKTPDKKDDLQMAAYNNSPGFATMALYAVGEGIFPETKGRRAPAPGW